MTRFPQEFASGEAIRIHEASFLRLNSIFNCDESPFSEGYCGLLLSIPKQDHDIVRPVYDELLGDGSVGGNLTATENPSGTWTRDMLIESARSFLEGKAKINTNDIYTWTIMLLFKILFDVEIDEARAVEIKIFNEDYFVFLTLPRSLALARFRARRAVNQFRSDLFKEVEGYIPGLIQSQRIKAVSDPDPETIKMLAFVLGEVVGDRNPTTALRNVLGAYYSGLVDNSFDMSSEENLRVVIMEALRRYAIVSAVGFVNADTGIREQAVIAMAHWDEDVFGPDDPQSFKVRMSFEEYTERMFSWNDRALPVEGQPATNRVCPAKALVFNIVIAFIEALDLSAWEASPTPPARGTTVWEDFDLTRVG